MCSDTDLRADIICSKKRTVFRERSSREIVSFEERIMSVFRGLENQIHCTCLLFIQSYHVKSNQRTKNNNTLFIGGIFRH